MIEGVSALKEVREVAGSGSAVITILRGCLIRSRLTVNICKSV